MSRKYLDFELIEKYPNKYDLTAESIQYLLIADWDRLKTKTWHNDAMLDTGNWWCHLEGCNQEGQKYDDSDEFWIGFREEDNKISCRFSAYDGMCRYMFEEFYDSDSIENLYDMRVQVNAIRWLNSMIDDGILSLPQSK